MNLHWVYYCFAFIIIINIAAINITIINIIISFANYYHHLHHNIHLHPKIIFK